MKSFLDVLFTLIWRLFGVAILFAIIGYGFNISAVSMFCIGFILNFIIGSWFTYFYNSKHEKMIANENNRIDEFIKRQCIKIQCAYCKKDNIVPLVLDTPIFKCQHCKNPNKLIFNFNSVQITTPVNTKDMVSQYLDESEAQNG